MMFVSRKEGRISLRVKLEAVSRPGVLFSDCNATRRDANLSESPDIVRFEIVKATSCFAVPELLRHFFQAEVLVPSPLPPHLIVFPSQKASKSKERTRKNRIEKEQKGQHGSVELKQDQMERI